MIREQYDAIRKANARQLKTIRETKGLLSDSKTGFVQGKLLALLICTLVLTIVDGLLTIKLLSLGAWEANPVMRYALSISHEFFILIKYVLTAGGLLVLLRFGKVSILAESITLEQIAAGIVLFYQGLVLYEIECFLLLG